MTPTQSKQELDSADPKTAAALWMECLHRDSVSESDRAAFNRWCEVSEAHSRAYADLSRDYENLRKNSEIPAILSLRHETSLRLTREVSRSAGIARYAWAATVLVAVGAGVFAYHSSAPTRFLAWAKSLPRASHHFQTGTGELLEAVLKDGSHVTLDTQSELEVAFTDAERLVRLDRGQVYFEVAKDKSHPFVVEVNGRRLVAVGTAFDVRVVADQVHVTMTEGTVRVEPPEPARGTLDRRAHDVRSTSASEAQSPDVLISAGDQLVIGPGGIGELRTVKTDKVTGWRQGLLMFDGTPLQEAVAEVNRYSDKKISLEDPSLGNIPISGSFAAGKPEVFVEAITTYFPIVVESQSKEIVSLKRR